jgi:hypothetical protein
LTQGELYKTLAQWRTLTSQDLNSNIAPIPVSSVDDIYFYYNETLVEKTIEIPQPSLDMYGVRYTTGVTLQPFTSIILLRDGTNHYISSSGSDSNDGLTAGTTWKTISKVNSHTFVSGDQIRFKSGDSFYGNLTINQSGSTNKPIIYTSYGSGLEPIITGLSGITQWTNLSGNIWESTNAVSTLDYLNIVTVGDVNTPMGRTPNVDQVYIFESHDDALSAITCSGLTGTPDWTGAEVVIRKEGWVWQVATVTSQSGSTIYYADKQPGIYVPRADNCGFFFQADPKTLTEQNDWYYNTSTKKLQMYSVGSPANVKVPTLNSLVTMYNKDYVEFDNIHFNGSNKWSVFINTSDYVKVTNCVIDKIGLYGVITYADNYTLIDNNTFNDCNHVAINSGGGSSTSIITNNIITNTYMIQGIGESVYPLGSICISSNNTLVQYNNIDMSGYNGIIASSSSIQTGIIKNNFINNSMQKLSDGGGIYTAGYHTDLLIEENIILNSLGYPLGAPGNYVGAKGIYLDIHAQNITARNNTVSGCNEAGISMSCWNVNNTFQGNILFDNKRNMDITNLSSASWSGTTNSNIVSGNTFVTKHSGDTVAKFQSLFINDIENFFSNIDYNTYARPINDTSTIFYYQPSIVGPNSHQPLSVWKTFIGQDTNSIASPYTIVSENDVYLAYNENKTTSVISLPFTSKDLSGNIYTSNITLQPFSSKVLFKN